MKFSKLTEVRFEHEYFGGLFSAFGIRPTLATRKVLKDYGIEFKVDFGRFFIVYDQFHAGKSRERAALLDQNLVLFFSLDLTAPMLLNYTAPLDLNLSQQDFYFSNSKIERECLHQELFVSNKDIYNKTSRVFPNEGIAKPFGKIALKISRGLLSTYVVRFEALATYWRYVLVDSQLSKMLNLSIVDKETQKSFAGPIPISLPFGKEGISFISTMPIKLSARYTTKYQLLDTSGSSPQKGRVLIRALQHPNPAHISLLPQEEGLKINRNYSEIII